MLLGLGPDEERTSGWAHSRGGWAVDIEISRDVAENRVSLIGCAGSHQLSFHVLDL